MHFINNIKDKFSYHFIVGAVAASFLCSVRSYGAEITDAELEGRIAGSYKVFEGLTFNGAKQPICRAIQFVTSLADSDDPESERMIAMILRDGRGVGGIDTNRSANESETGVYYSLLGMLKTKGVSKDVFYPTAPDTTTVLGRHQLALSIAYDAILVPAATGSVQPFVNYVTDRGAYTTLNRLCQAIWALRQGDWSALGAEIPASVQVKLTDSTLGLSEPVKANLLSHALTLPNSERESFVLETVNLLPTGCKIAIEKVTKVLLTLPVSDWLRYMKLIDELYSISFNSTEKQLSILPELNIIFYNHEDRIKNKESDMLVYTIQLLF